MTQGFLEARVCSYVSVFKPDNIYNQVESVLYVYGARFSEQLTPECCVEFSWAPRLGITSISFPFTESLVGAGLCAGFERGLWVENHKVVRWVLMVPDDDTQIQTCVFSRERAIAARVVLYGIFSGVGKFAEPCRLVWGSTPDIQCVGCGRVYVVGLGWSDKEFPSLKKPPKIACPVCYPKP